MAENNHLDEDRDFEDSIGGYDYTEDIDWEEDWGESWEDIPWYQYKIIRNGKWASTIYTAVLAIVLIYLGIFVGWKAIDDEITNLPSETQSTQPSPVETSTNETAEASPAVETTPSAEAPPSENDAAQDSKKELRFAAGQHYMVLSLIIGVFVMLPSFLWIIFTFGQADQVIKDFYKDLSELGLIGQNTQTEIFDYSKTLKGGMENTSTEEDIIEKVIKDRLSWFRYFIPLLLITILIFASFIWAFWPASFTGFVQKLNSSSYNLIKYFWEDIITEMTPAVGAVLTAYAFMIFSFLRRLGRSDVTPRFFWTIFQRLALAFLLGMIGSVIFQGSVTIAGKEFTGHWAAFGMGVLVGIVPEGALKLLAEYIQAALLNIMKDQGLEITTDLTTMLEKKHPLSLLDDLDLWDQLRLAEEGVVGCQGLVEDNIKHLMTFTPFTTRQIVDWIDQAIVFLVAGAEKTARYDIVFRKIGMRNASDLVYFCQTDVGKRTVWAAATAIQTENTPSTDPLPQAQLAALKASIKINSTQADADGVKNLLAEETNDTNIKEDTKKKIQTAITAVQETKLLTDEAQKHIKNGGSILSPALDAANNLQAKLKSANEKANELEEVLKENKVNDTIKTALKSFGESLSTPENNDGKTLANNLIKELDKIEKPLAVSQTKANELHTLAKAIKTEAEQGKKESVPEEGPASVVSAAEKLTELTSALENAKKTLDENSDLSDPATKIEELLTSLKDNETEGKPLKLVEALKKSEQWTQENSDKQAAAVTLATSLVSQCKSINTTITNTADEVEKAQITALTPSTAETPPLTMEILETLLIGMERQGNIRQIESYKISDSKSIPQKGKYTRMKEWKSASPQRKAHRRTFTRGQAPIFEEEHNEELMQLPNMTEDMVIELKEKQQIKTLDSLFLKSQTPNERKALLDAQLLLNREKNILLNHELLLRWVNIIDLTRIPGVDFKNADLLQRAKVNSPQALSKQDLKSLPETLQQINDKYQIIDENPTEKKYIADQLTVWKKASETLAQKVFTKTERAT